MKELELREEPYLQNIPEAVNQAHTRGRGRGHSSPSEIFRLELSSATKVKFFVQKWTAVNGS